MSLQHLTLREFREKHPRATFRQISQMTGIQITRIFRLFNGASMSLAEWEAFERLQDPNGQEGRRRETLKLAERLLSELSLNGVNELWHLLGRKQELLGQRRQS